MGFHDKVYSCIPCYQCRECQRFSGKAYGYGDGKWGCQMLFEPEHGTTGATDGWDPDRDGTYQEECKFFKRKDSNSEKHERPADNTPRELTETDKFIFKIISFLVSGFGYVFIAWVLMYSLTGNAFSEIWIWGAGTLVLGIIIGILKAKTKRLGMILYIIGFLLIVVGFVLPKVLSNS